VSATKLELGRAQRHADEMERELGRSRRVLAESSRQLEADAQRQLSGYVMASDDLGWPLMISFIRPMRSAS
jgi:hypothetical protein